MPVKKEIPIEQLTPEGMLEFILSELKKVEIGERAVPKYPAVAARLRSSEYEQKLVYWGSSASNSTGRDKNSKMTDPYLFETYAATPDEMAAVAAVVKMMVNGRDGTSLPISGQSLWIKYHEARELMDEFPDISDLSEDISIPRAGGNCLIIKIRNTSKVALNTNGEFLLTDVKEWKRFVYYGGTALYSAFDSRKGVQKNYRDEEWTPSGYAKGERTIYPSTMKDLMEGYRPGECIISDLIMEYFSQSNLLWNDLRKDFAAKSAYAAIPASDIWTSHSRQELIQKRFQFSLKRNNKEPIGHGIFLAKASKMVKEEELEHLFGYDPGFSFISRKKRDMTEILARYIYKNCPNVDVPFPLPHGRALLVSETYIRDALDMDVSMRKKSSITYRSTRAIYEWHERNVLTLRRRGLPTVKIPRDSIFKDLKMPSDCVRLKTRNDFIEEGDFQNNCVTGYIQYVNDDDCSIWSQRKPDGTRNTIEIAAQRRGGRCYFEIIQMVGFANGDCSREDYNKIRQFLQEQNPPVLRRA